MKKKNAKDRMYDLVTFSVLTEKVSVAKRTK